MIKPFSLFIFSLIFAGFLGAFPAWAASCCGGGSSFPGLIIGDYKAQLTTSLAYSAVVADAIDGDYFARPGSTSETGKTFLIDAAHRIGEYAQVSLQVPIQERSKGLSAKSESDSGIGDVSLAYSYEILPELTYSNWKPRGFLFSRWKAPTSPSLYDSNNVLKTDVRGEGFHSLSVGMMFVRQNASWDFLGGYEYQHRFSRDISSFYVEPGDRNSLILGFGYSFSKSPLRLGWSSQVIHTNSVHVFAGNNQQISDAQQVTNSTLTASYLFPDDIMVSGSYNDQTLFGPSRNIPLERSITLQAQKRWGL